MDRKDILNGIRELGIETDDSTLNELVDYIILTAEKYAKSLN